MMEESEETISPARRTTRSRKVTKTPVVKSPKAKPATRRTRKKVVLMEVEVSDEEEETPQEVDVSEDDKQQENTEKESPDCTEKESEETESKQKSKEMVDVNGSENNDDGAVPDSTEDSVTVVFNDVDMLEGADDSNSRDQDDDDDESNITESKVGKKSDDKMEVETTSVELVDTTTSVELVETKKTAITESHEAHATKDEKKEPQPVVAEQTETATKTDLSEVTKANDEIKKESIADKPQKDPVILPSPEVQETKMEVDEVLEDKIAEQKAEKKTTIKDLAQKQISADTKKSTTEVDEKAVVKVDEKAVDKVAEKAVVKVDEKVVAKVEEAVCKVEEKAAADVEEQSVTEVEKKSVTKVEEKVVEVEEKVVEVEEEVVKVEEKVVKDEEKVVKVGEKAVTKVEEKPVTKVEEKPVTEVQENPISEVEEKPIAKAEEEPMCVDEEKMMQGEESKTTPKAGKTENKAELEKGDETNEQKESIEDQAEKNNKPGDTDAENISEDELPVVQAVKVPEAEEVSDEELPGPKRAELPADTEVVSEDELPTVKTETKKEGTKRKLDATDYDPGSPTSENEAPAKKPSLEAAAEKEKDEKPKPKKLPELDKYWKAVNDDPTDFTGWTYLLQYVDQENDMEAAREAYDAFLSHYPYCYGYWRKYADYEKRKGNKKKCEEVFERGLKAIPLSVDLWIHYLTYVKTTRTEDEEFIRSQFERALTACGLEFRSDRLWESYIKWETEGKRLRKVTAIYDRLLATPTQSYTSHFDSFQEHIANNPPNKVIEVDEFLALRKEVRHMLKHDVTTDTAADNSDAPPGDDDQTKVVSSDEETKSIRERIVSIRRKAHKATVNAVTARWNYEEGIKRPYFHVKPLERCQLKNWQDYLDYETEQGDRIRVIVLFERCLIACALYEEFWLKFVHYLETLKDPELHSKIRDVYERACTIHHLKKPSLHLQWAMFEESVENPNRAAEILVNLEKSVPNILQIAYRRINLERRRSDHEKCAQLYEHYITNSKNKMISSNIAIKFSRFCFKIMKDFEKAQEVLKGAITKDPNNPRLYLQLIDLTLQKENVTDAEIIEIIDSFLDKETTDVDQKVLFSQRKLEYVEDFGADVQSVQAAYEQYQKWLKQSKDSSKKKEVKTEAASSSSKKEKSATPSSSTTNTYSNYGTYGNSSAQPSYPYSGSQQGQNYYPQYGQGDQQYQYQNWQYPQGGYGGYNQWGGYSGGYGY